MNTPQAPSPAVLNQVGVMAIGQPAGEEGYRLQVLTADGRRVFAGAIDCTRVDAGLLLVGIRRIAFN